MSLPNSSITITSGSFFSLLRKFFLLLKTQQLDGLQSNASGGFDSRCYEGKSDIHRSMGLCMLRFYMSYL